MLYTFLRQCAKFAETAAEATTPVEDPPAPGAPLAAAPTPNPHAAAAAPLATDAAAQPNLAAVEARVSSVEGRSRRASKSTVTKE